MASTQEFTPVEALSYFKRKNIKPGFDYRDVWKDEHNNSFTVAKMMKLDILQDTQSALAEALAQGQTYEQFRNNLKPTLIKKGWWGEQWIDDPATGEVKLVQLGSDARLKTIYRTNMRTARAAGQWDRIQRTKRALPYLLYQLGPSREHRPEHKNWNGLILPVDDAFWQSHYPPNGWGCKCWVRQISQRAANDMIEKGNVLTEAPPVQNKEWVNKRTGEVEAVPKGVDPGWSYNPGVRLANQANNLMTKAVTADPLVSSQAVNEVMQVKAISGEVGKSFSHAVGDAIKQIESGVARARGTTWHLGAIPMEAIEQLNTKEIYPASAVISIQDGDLLHLVREAKVKRKSKKDDTTEDKSVPKTFLENLPEELTRPKAILLDKQQKTHTLLYVYDMPNDEASKITIKLDYTIKVNKEKIKSNAIKSGEVTSKLKTLKDANQYEVVWGSLED